MNAVAALLQLSLTATVLLVSGYAAVGWFRSVDTPTRLLAAPVAGLAVLLWNVSVINLVAPLHGLAATAVLWAAAATLLTPRLRRLLIRDLRHAAAQPRAWAVGLAGLAMAGVLLLPLLEHPDLVFFDGTSNHDNFFWIVGADYLQNQSYLSRGDAAGLPPRFATVQAILGLSPAWGRMGAEGWIAAMAAIGAVTPLRWYVGGTAALILPWLGTTLLLVRAIGWLPRSPLWLGLGCALQPLFFFFIANGNLPNLCGSLCGGGLLVAAHLATQPPSGARRLGLVMIPVLLHGMLVSYPEVAPFVGLSAGLLVVARWLRPPATASRRSLILPVLGAVGAGLLLNVVTTLRAVRGFMASFHAARADGHWPNLFEELSPGGYLPASLTLAIDTFEFFGASANAAIALLLAGAILWGLARAREHTLAITALAGYVALVGYTLATDFSYGWQKATQFSAIPLAALYPFGVAAPLLQRDCRRAWLRPALVSLFWIPLGWSGFDLVRDFRAVAAEKGVTETMLTMPAQVAATPASPVLVIGRSFRMPYFHTMWTAHLLNVHAARFASDAPRDGGYLADQVTRFERTSPPAAARGYFVGRAWADAFCSDLPRVAQDRVFAVLPLVNHVQLLEGLLPSHDEDGLKGVPLLAAPEFALSIEPAYDGEFEIELRPMGRRRSEWRGALRCDGDAGEATLSETHRVDHNGRIILRVPIAAGRTQRITGTLSVPATVAERPSAYPFAVERIRVRTTAPVQAGKPSPSS